MGLTKYKLHILLLKIGLYLTVSCSKKTIDNEPPVLEIPPIDVLEINNVVAFGQDLSAAKKVRPSNTLPITATHMLELPVMVWLKPLY